MWDCFLGYRLEIHSFLEKPYLHKIRYYAISVISSQHTNSHQKTRHTIWHTRVCGCGWYNRNLKLSDREWLCPACNTLNDRDGLAANNIMKFAFINRRADGVSLGSCGAVMPSVEPLGVRSVKRYSRVV